MKHVELFAQLTLPEFSGFLTILAGMLVGFYALVKFMLKQSEELANNDREERKFLAEAVNNMAVSMEKVATSNERIADESKERNGHLAEITVQSRDQVIEQIRGLTIEQQTVHNQTVEHEKVLKKE